MDGIKIRFTSIRHLSKSLRSSSRTRHTPLLCSLITSSYRSVGRFGKGIFRGTIFGLLLLGSGTYSNGQDASSDALQKEAAWNWPELRVFQEQLASYLDLSNATAEQRSAVQQAWNDLNAAQRGPEVLNRLLTVCGIVDPRVTQSLARLNSLETSQAIQEFVALKWFDAKVPGWLQDNLRLAIAKGLAQRSLYDEAIQVLETLDEKNVVDPSSLMFYRAICFHHLLQKEKCVEQLDRLLQRESELATRFVVTAKLMRSDIDPLKEDSLDEVARLMNDVERRLVLGRAGVKVREQERTIVEKLDKLIEKIEEQIQQQQQQQQEQQSSQNKPKNGQSQAMEDSRIAGGSGPGDVDPKKLEQGNEWGDLPPAQRQEALQNIMRDLPSHYREVIEAYFKRLGTGDR